MSSKNNFTFLRLLFALLVLLAHAPEMIDGNRGRELLTLWTHRMSFGDLGVDCFFIISGFLVSKSWEERPHLSVYLKKRVLRIYPGFIAAFFLSALVIGRLGAASSAYFFQLDYTGLLRDAALLLQPSTPAVFPGHPWGRVNGALWTIHYEAFCYLAVAAIGLSGLFKRRIFWLTLLLCCFVMWMNLDRPIFGPLLTVLTEGSLSQIFRFATFFVTGACFYLFRSKIRYSKSGAAIAVTALFLSLNDDVWFQLMLATFGAYLLFFFAFAKLPVLKWFQGAPDISYGTYLYGWPAQKLLVQYFPELSPWAVFMFSVIVSCVCGYLSWHFVEKRFMRKEKRKRISAAVSLR